MRAVWQHSLILYNMNTPLQLLLAPVRHPTLPPSYTSLHCTSF